MADRTDVGAALAHVAMGDHRALAVLYRATAPRLYGLCLRILGDPAQAADALEDIYAAVWSGADDFDPGQGTAMAWLVTLARDIAIDRRRATGAAPDPGPQDAAPRRGAAGACLDQLPGRQAEAVERAWFDGQDAEALAAHWGVDAPRARARLLAGLFGLRRCLAG